MRLWQPPVTIYEAAREPTAETTITDVLLGAAAVVLGLAALAVGLGLALAGMMIVIRRLRGGRTETGSPPVVTRLGLDGAPVRSRQNPSAATRVPAGPSPSDQR